MKLEIPIEYNYEDGHHIITNNDETNKFLNIPIVVQAKSLEKAINNYWETVRCHLDYLEKRDRELDKWKPFQKGDWNHIGGNWFTVFGLNFYFRYGKNMKHGFYIPFTKLNIMFKNYWL